VAFTPASETLNVAGDFGSILVTAIQTLPALSLAATASTRGRVTPFVVETPGSKVSGTKVASWNGTYMWKT
jgi:hypothetical protein